ncbi:MAG: hypothetical protein ACXVCP_19755 [Bdellovibrio sp.]
MKKVLLSLTSLFLLTNFSLAASAAEYKSDLTNVVADEQFGRFPIDGTLTYDRDNKTLKLFIGFRRTNCPDGLVCTMEIPTPISVELPIKSIKPTTCGAKVIIAEKNAILVDGAYQQIKLIDNSKNNCEYLQAIPAIQGEYTEKYQNRGSGIITLKAKFDGSAFAEILK